ncbi:MAG: hypothetical protein IKL55_00240 [Clostridia bacterium]|nr:hypothetical protein [Clostridia bacterium]
MKEFLLMLLVVFTLGEILTMVSLVIFQFIKVKSSANVEQKVWITQIAFALFTIAKVGAEYALQIAFRFPLAWLLDLAIMEVAIIIVLFKAYNKVLSKKAQNV